MAKIINLGTALVTRLAVEDEHGNALLIAPLEIPIVQPSRESIAQAGEEWERRIGKMRARPQGEINQLFAEAVTRSVTEEENAD